MTKLSHRFLPVFLALVLALGLAVPALAATVEVTGVSLDRTELSLAPGESATLVPTVFPSDASNKAVTWKSNKTSVVDVKNGVVTAKAFGTADVTVTTNDGGYSAVCQVTVEEAYATGVTITPPGPDTVPVGKTLQLTAHVSYSHDIPGNQEVTWSTSAPGVASVSPQGLVTALAVGEAEIIAMTKAVGQNGAAFNASYRLTVTESLSGHNSEDELFLPRTAEAHQGGLHQTLTLNAPSASVVRHNADASADYTFSYVWTDSQGNVLSTDRTLSLPLTKEGEVKVTCTVTATSLTDSTKQPLTGTCVYTIEVKPGILLEGVLDVNAGATRLDQLMDAQGTKSILDQLTSGPTSSDSVVVEELVDVVFYPENAAGDAGALNVADGERYGVTADAKQPLGEVVFTPLTAGLYSIPFTANGAQTYHGQLVITVTGEIAPVPDPVVEADMSCASSGLTFTGSDFYSAGDSDPVAFVVFGKPAAGQLLRDMAFGSGIPDIGSKYYIDSAKDGDYHVSTLSYLPPAGFAGKVTIPVTATTRSGILSEDVLTIDVIHKISSENFIDVTPENTGIWSADAVDFASDMRLVNGTGEKTFSPDATMTRAMLVTVLYRAAGSPDMTVTTNFTDLDPNSYYYNAVVWANAMGVVTGTSETTFTPDAPVTREQIAVILFRYADLLGTTDGVTGANLDVYADHDQVSDYAIRGMSWAVSRGIITGTSETTLSPNDPATRAQVVVMLHRYLAV